MASYSITVPEINGSFEAGITVGIDPSLPDDQKLPVLQEAGQTSTLAFVKSSALAWAYKNPKFASNLAKSMACNAIAAIFDLGLVAMKDSIPDGDWKTISTQPQLSAEEATAVSKILSQAEMKKMVSLIVCTKITWWMINHHIGQGAATGYVAKCINTQFGAQSSKEVADVAYILGHWCSTRRILTIAGIKGIAPVMPVVINGGVSLVLTDDAKLRINSPPAGTHKTAIAYEACKRLVSSQLFALFPDPQMVLMIKRRYENVMKDTASHHIGAAYLTGKPRAAFADTDMDECLGRLGAFVLTMYPKSTLAQSPHLTKTRVESYPDYSLDWSGACTSYRQAASTAQKDIVSNIETSLRPKTSDELDKIRADFR